MAVAGAAVTKETPVSAEIFKQSMRLLAGGVCIATTGKDGGEWLGLTVTAVSSLTLEPPTVIVCVNRDAGAHTTMHASRRLCVNFLASDHVELAQLFSSSSFKGSGRFDPSKWTAMTSGLPALIGALAALDCEIIDQMTFGQHSVFICEVKAVRLEPEKEPLVHFNREFCELLPIA